MWFARCSRVISEMLASDSRDARSDELTQHKAESQALRGLNATLESEIQGLRSINASPVKDDLATVSARGVQVVNMRTFAGALHATLCAGEEVRRPGLLERDGDARHAARGTG